MAYSENRNLTNATMATHCPTQFVEDSKSRATPGYFLYFISLVSLLALAGCATTDKTSEWRDPAYTGDKLNDILVIGVSKQVSVRRTFESNLVVELQKRNVNAVPSTSFMDMETKIDHETVKAAIADKKIDAVLVTHLVGVEKKQTYVAPTPVMASGYYGYYSMAYNRSLDPGYYEQYEVMKLETSLYDVNTEKLVWSMGSDTMDSGSNDKVIKSNIEAVIKALGNQGFF